MRIYKLAGIEEDVRNASETQRGVPESVMMSVTLDIQKHGAPAKLVDLLEHIGDLSHRAQAYNSLENVNEKIRKVEVTMMSGRWSLEEEMEYGFKHNAEMEVYDENPEYYQLEEDIKSGKNTEMERYDVYQKLRKEKAAEIDARIQENKQYVMAQLKKYVQAHEEHNQPITYLGKLGKEAAIALGNFDFDRLRYIIMEMRAWLDRYQTLDEAGQDKMFYAQNSMST